MIPEFLDSTFKTIDVVDIYESFMWIDRYCGFGEFELKTKPSDRLFSNINNSVYFKLEESDHLMFIETATIHTDIEEGNDLIIKGRSLESMLDRRIVWVPTTMHGILEDKIELLLNTNVISASPTSRQISNFIFVEAEEEIFKTLEMASQFYGETLYEVITDICEADGLGYKIILNSSNQFAFSLYVGVDRSFNQSTNPFIVFSPSFDNLIDSDYIKTNQFLKNYALVAGEEGVANVRFTNTASIGSPTGLNRREMFVNASDIKRRTPGTTESDQVYLDLLAGRGYEELAKNKIIEVVDGEVDTSLFTFGEDFGMGDIVQLEDSYGHQSRSRIIEVIYSQDLSGKKIIPIFSAI